MTAEERNIIIRILDMPAALRRLSRSAASSSCFSTPFGRNPFGTAVGALLGAAAAVAAGRAYMALPPEAQKAALKSIVDALAPKRLDVSPKAAVSDASPKPGSGDALT